MDDCVQVTTTTASEDDARALATGLVEQRLAACVQVLGPITSVYRWEGAVQTETEWLCVAKTTAARLDELTAWVKGHHGYDVPEIVATPVVGGADDYLRWVTEETTPR